MYHGMEWKEQASPPTPHFSPVRERELRRHIGDYTRFMPGRFREHVEGMSITGYYIREGKRAYRFVSEHDRAGAWPHAGLFRALADLQATGCRMVAGS